MSFVALEFLFGFLPVAILAAWIVRVWSTRHTVTVLVAASLLFYGWGRPGYLGILIGSMIWNYAFGSQLIRMPGKMLLSIAIGGNVLLLVSVKIATMSFVDTALSPLLPLGISFIVIQQIAYLTDAYRGTIGRQSIAEYMLFTCFFPRILAGPIVRWQEFVPQLRSNHLCARFDDVIVGWSIFLVGLGKKVMLANTLGGLSDTVFALAANGAVPPPYYAWGGVIAFGLQLYFDFSGYSDMAVGAARMFGITLPENFLAPYRAENIADFWRRWHISLYRFLRDILYIPLGGNRCGVPRTLWNIFIVTLCAGLWHGFAWTFVAWGALHGAFLSVYILWQKRGFPLSLPKVLATGLTTACVLLAWIPFRSPSLATALRMYGGMVGQLPDTPTGPLLTAADIQGWEYAPLWIGVGLFLVYCCPTTQHIFRVYDPVLHEREIAAPKGILWVPSWKPTARWGVAFALLTACALHALAWRATPFLYFQF